MRVADGALHLNGDSDAVPLVRRWVTEALVGTPHVELSADAELVVSELVTNALLHGAPPIVVRVEIADTVRIEVSDGSRAAPVRALARNDAMTGRGLALVDAVSRDWGVSPRPGGKVIWSELGAEVDGDEDLEPDIDALLAAWDDDIDLDGETRYTVTLGDVPTDLLLGAKAHVDNVVREFTLASHGAESGRTAAIPEQLADLFEDVVGRFAEARQAIKRQAVEAATRGDERTTLTLTLPVTAADAGERYLAALDQIDSYARAARLLTLETPPQHRVFRRWYVESLVAQLRAAAAGTAVDRPLTFEGRLLMEVAAVENAYRVVERSARLQAVTAALAATTTAADVGRVVVSEGVDALAASGGGMLLVGAGHAFDVAASVGYAAPLVDKLRSESPDAELPAAVAIRTGRPVWLESREERDEQFPALSGLEPRTLAMCAVPLHAGDHLLGALRFSFDTPRLFDTDERRFVLTLADQTAQALERAAALAEARAANDKLTFLADASAVLAESLDLRATLQSIAGLAVPRLADWCAVHLVEGDRIPALAVAHVDPDKVALAYEFDRRYPVDPHAPVGVAKTVRESLSVLTPDLAPETLAAVARDDEHLALMLSLGLRSALVVPLAARGQVFGAISMFYAESNRRYDETDLAVAEDLAHRAALAIDTANRLADRG